MAKVRIFDSGATRALAAISRREAYCSIGCAVRKRISRVGAEIFFGKSRGREMFSTHSSLSAYNASHLLAAPSVCLARYRFGTGRVHGARGGLEAHNAEGASPSPNMGPQKEVLAEQRSLSERQLFSAGTAGGATSTAVRADHIDELARPQKGDAGSSSGGEESVKHISRQPRTTTRSNEWTEGPVSLPSLFEGEVEEEDCAEQFLQGLYNSDVATHRHARMWLKPDIQCAPLSPATDGRAACDHGARRTSSWSDDAPTAPRQDSRHRSTEGGACVDSSPESRELRHVSSCLPDDRFEESGDFFSDDDDTYPRGSALSASRSSQRSGLGSPGATLLSRLALAEREALGVPRRRGGSGETYGQWSDRVTRIQQERTSASDARSLALDRRHIAQIDGEQDLGAHRERYSRYSGARRSRNQAAVGAPRRMRVLDLDSVSPAVLHHSFMFLLVKHLPAEVCLKVLSRIAVYRDVHTQLAYENLIRDMGFLFTKHYETCTSVPHDLGPTLVAYVCRVVQTLSIAWGVNYVRRFGCFSKQFIVKQIERSANPRLFDFVRYAHKGGVKPLPPIVTHPHRLSSYVRLLDESSSKFYMYTHLKRHKQLPLQHQLHPSTDPQIQGESDGGDGILSFDGVPPYGTGHEDESRLPRAFVAAEKALQPAKGRQAIEADKGGLLGTDEAGGEAAKTVAGRRMKQASKKTATVKRPPIYDLILAAEHLGVEYQELQRQMLKEQEDSSSSEDEDETERELRDLVDNAEVFKHIRNRYYRGQVERVVTDMDDSDDEVDGWPQEESDSGDDAEDDLRVSRMSGQSGANDPEVADSRQERRGPPTRAERRLQAEDASQAPGSRFKLDSSARLQTTPIAPSFSKSFLDISDDKSVPRRGQRETENSEEGQTSLVPVETEEKGQWGWTWEFESDARRRRPSSYAAEEADEDGIEAERWWGTAWGRGRTAFRYKGRAYGIVPGEGWKLLEGEKTLKLLRPKRRFGKHQPKRERRTMRRLTARRVREQVLQGA
ncbi:hypothetical protein BESB_034620 [Besnoitia besnoiti]|uniref:Uncharacterized protein n=1 Tax=Besnoitia besnoiti TaxID=94643 RepID=A0A2A9MIH3_BESBE|nr:hypothetical protein BESB_034620 [Besnoitia besnoiti]PFH37004.1 hypothetical protein BESB_034620 [Besnoitia besnoiti]